MTPVKPPNILLEFPQENPPAFLSVIPSEITQENPLEVPSENLPRIFLMKFSRDF